MKTQNGFSLIELMIVIVIVGLLASIAYPAYQEQIEASRRADCAGALTGLAGAMERYFTVNNTYVGATLGNAAGDIFAAQCPVEGGPAMYNLAITAASASAFTIQAARTGAQAGDECGTLQLDSTGLKAVVGADAGVTAADCW